MDAEFSAGIHDSLEAKKHAEQRSCPCTSATSHTYAGKLHVREALPSLVNLVDVCVLYMLPHPFHQGTLVRSSRYIRRILAKCTVRRCVARILMQRLSCMSECLRPSSRRSCVTQSHRVQLYSNNFQNFRPSQRALLHASENSARLVLGVCPESEN